MGDVINEKEKLLVILGPTATGKTDLALSLAKKFNGELISCDSRQVYRDLEIGTGKLPSKSKKLKVKRQKYCWEINGIKVWLYDVVDPKNQYTVADYVKDGERVIGEIRGRGKLPIIVGGTGLYLKALLEGLPNLAIPVDKKLRKELEYLSIDDLQKKLQQNQPERWEKMNNSDRQNRRRLIRAIELAGATLSIGKVQSFDALKIGLTAPRDILYKKADERVLARIKQGMVDEAKNLYQKGLSLKRMRSLGLEYGVLADYLDGKIKDRLVTILQGKIHGFLRRQLTWFKKEKDVNWFDITDSEFPSNVENLVAKWYDRAYATKN